MTMLHAVCQQNYDNSRTVGLEKIGTDITYN